jgi:hypothetical protein
MEKVDPFIASIKFIDDSRGQPYPPKKKLIDNQIKSNKSNILEEDSDAEIQPTTAQKRREKVRIPAIYFEKSSDDRLKDQNDLLNRF